MRKLLLSAGLALVVSASFAQKIDDVKKDVAAGKYTDAKTKIDQLMSDPKTASSSDALFYKAVIYQNLGKQANDTAMTGAALAAMRSYVDMEKGKPEGQRMLASMLEGNKTLVDMYQSNVNTGVEKLKANNYASAFYNFQSALNAFEVLKASNLVKANFDTTITYYAGASAQNAKMDKEAMRYYNQLISNNIADTSYLNVYRYMINASLENKDTAAAKKYLGISQAKYPQQSDLWVSYQTLFLPTDKSQRFAAYEELIKANPKNEGLAMDYAIEMYNNIRSDEAASKDSSMRLRAETALKNALAMNPNSATANLLISQLYWTEYYTLQSQIDNIHGTFPQAIAKKKELNGKVDAVFEKALPYLQKSYDIYNSQTTIKPQDRANFRIVLNQLSDYYTRKKQPTKAAEYQAKLKTLQ